MFSSIVAGKAAYNPPYEKIKAKYFEKFRGKGGSGDDKGTTVKSGEAGPSNASPPGLSQACASPSSDAGLLPFGLLRATRPDGDVLRDVLPQPWVQLQYRRVRLRAGAPHHEEQPAERDGAHGQGAAAKPCVGQASRSPLRLPTAGRKCPLALPLICKGRRALAPLMKGVSIL